LATALLTTSFGVSPDLAFGGALGLLGVGAIAALVLGILVPAIAIAALLLL